MPPFSGAGMISMISRMVGLAPRPTLQFRYRQEEAGFEGVEGEAGELVGGAGEVDQRQEHHYLDF